MEQCINCGDKFKQEYNTNDCIMSEWFCKSCNRNIRLSFMMTMHLNSIKAAEFLFCMFINQIYDTEIFDLGEYKELANENDCRE